MASIGANGSRGHHRFTLNVNETSTSTANNTSTVSWSLVLSPITTGYDWNYSSTVPVTYSININGAVYTGNIMSYNGSATVTVRSGTQTIAHNNDGTKSIGFSFSVSSINKSYLPGDASASGSMNLTTILRQATITNAPNFNDEENPTITYSNPLGNSVTTLQACISLTGSTDDIAYRDISKTGTSYTFELTTAERNILRSATTSNSRTVKFFVKTIYGGNTYYSSLNKTFSIINGNPIFENFTYQDTNTTITNITQNNQVLVKGLSTLQVVISSANKMEAVKEATEKNYVLTVDTINQSENYSSSDLTINLGTINATGTQRLNVRAYDSRNNSTLVYKDIMVYDYTVPSINFTAERLNNFEAQTTLKVSGSFASLLIDNVEKNNVQSIQYRYQEIGSDTWSSWTNITYTTSGNTFTCPDTIVALDNTKEFIIEVKVADNLSNNSATATIDVGEAIFFISSNLKKAYVNDEEVYTKEQLETLLNAYKPKILWQNSSASPTSFSSQTITFSSSDYDYFEVYSYDYVGTKNIIYNRVPKGKNFIIASPFWNAGVTYIGTRTITRRSDTEYSAGNARSADGNVVVNDWMMPILIIGHKYYDGSTL